MREQFGELRHLVEQRPSTSAFANIIYFLEHHDSPETRHEIQARWIPYLSGKLDGWPDPTRQCPKSLNERYELDAAVWCPLIRSLDFEQEKLAKKRTARLLAATHMKDVTGLDLRSAYIKWSQLVDFATEAPFGKLSHIAFRKGTKSADLAALGQFFGSPMLEQVTSLSFAGWSNIKPDVYDVLLAHFPVENLRRLDLSGSRIISAKRLQGLFETGRFSNLEEFEFRRRDNMGSQGLIGPIARAADLTKLRVIRGAWAKGKDLEALARCEHLTNLEELHLIDIQCEAADLTAWLDAGNLPALKHLSIGLNRHGKKGRGEDVMRAIGESKLVRQVATLDLSSNAHLDLTAFLDAAGHDLDHLTHFSWRPWCHGDEELAPIVRGELEALARTSFGSLLGLTLKCYTMHQASRDHGLCDVLLEAPFLPALRELHVLGECFHPQDVLRMVTDSRFPALEVLGVQSPLDVAQWQELVTQADLSRLEVLRTWKFEPHQTFLEFCELLATHTEHLPRLSRILASTALDYHIDKELLRQHEYFEANQWIALDTEYSFGDEYPIWLTR